MVNKQLSAVRVLFLTLLFCGAAGLSVSRAAAGPLEDGIEQYYYKRFHTAAMFFEEACAKDPMNWKPHFYLARTLEQLREYEAAKAEFEYCFRLNPFSKEGRLAKQAVLELASDREKRKHVAEDPMIVQQALRLLNMQSADLKGRIRAEANRLATDRMARAAQRLNLPVETNPNRYRRWYYRPDEEVSNRTYIQNSWHRNDAMREAALARYEAARRSVEIQKSANNLKLLIADPSNKPGNAKLRALGTNLYVRFYGSPERDDVPGEDKPLELRARQGLLSDLHLSTSNPIREALKSMGVAPPPRTTLKASQSVVAPVVRRDPRAYHHFGKW
jgi:tetratricopeptide (TPR) repeat protein